MTHLPYSNLGVPIQAFSPGTSQVVAVGNVSAQSAAFGNTTTTVRVTCDVDMRYKAGDSPVADGNSTVLWATGIEYLNVARGSKLAFISYGNSSGNVSVTEGS